MAKANKNILDKAWLEDVHKDKVFWCHDNRVMKNLDELVAALRKMSDDTFRYHVTKDKNDFSKWVRDVIGDSTLAEDLQKANIPQLPQKRWRQGLAASDQSYRIA